MKGFFARALASIVACLVIAACDSGDSAVEGAHRPCAFGGTSTDCADSERTPEGACWRLVDCGALVLDHEDENRFDWGECVDSIESLVDARQRAIIACIAASSCDELRASDHCGQFGDQ